MKQSSPGEDHRLMLEDTGLMGSIKDKIFLSLDLLPMFSLTPTENCLHKKKGKLNQKFIWANTEYDILKLYCIFF